MNNEDDGDTDDVYEEDLYDSACDVCNYIEGNHFASAEVSPQETIEFYVTIMEHCDQRITTIRKEHGL